VEKFWVFLDADTSPARAQVLLIGADFIFCHEGAKARRVFGRLGVLGKGFARCEHLRKPAVFAHKSIRMALS